MNAIHRTFDYDVALSFAGADREVARVVAGIGQENGLRMFIDEQYMWESWGKNLTEYLGEIYDQRARYCVILISKDYCKKSYTNLERRRALDRALEGKSEYILPVRLDDSWLDGLPRATAYLDMSQMSSVAVGEMLVRKVKGATTEVRVPEGIATPKVIPADRPILQPKGMTFSGAIDFVQIRAAAECIWKDADEDNLPFYEGAGNISLKFRGGFGSYGDPIFDIAVINRSSDPVLLMSVGIEIVDASFHNCKMLGGGWGKPLNLHRTYQLDLPDVWRLLAERESLGEERRRQVWSESAMCRLPDPIEIEAHRPYRFGLHLFDYTNYCPTEVDLFFCARTDRGISRSQRANLTYLVGQPIPPLERYSRLLEREAEVNSQEKYRLVDSEELQRQIAYQMWEHAGRPQGRDLEFWAAAHQKLPAPHLGVYKRPLLDNDNPQAFWRI